MRKRINERVIREQDKIDMMLDLLYNNPKFRRYDYVIDAACEYADRNNKGDAWGNTFIKFFETYQTKEFDDCVEILEQQIADGEDTLGEFAYTKQKIMYIQQKMREFIQSDIVNTDMFYTTPEPENDDRDVELMTHDYNQIPELIKAIRHYTTNYGKEITGEYARLIMNNMSKKSYPVYRIEPASGNRYVNYKTCKVGDVFSFVDPRTHNIKSATTEPDCESMKGMKASRGGSMDGFIVFETVGPIYTLSIDAYTDYASNLHMAEFEEFISGTFEIVDIENKQGGEHRIKIKQLSKEINADSPANSNVRTITEDELSNFRGATILSRDQLIQFTTKEQRAWNGGSWWTSQPVPEEFNHTKDQMIVVHPSGTPLTSEGVPYYDTSIVIRPTIIMVDASQIGLNTGDKFIFGKETFTVANAKMALCDTAIGARPYNRKGAADPFTYRGSSSNQLVNAWFADRKNKISAGK